MSDTYFCFYCKTNIKKKNRNRHENSETHNKAILKANQHLYLEQHKLRQEIKETYNKLQETEDKLIKKICKNNINRCYKEIEDLWKKEL